MPHATCLMPPAPRPVPRPPRSTPHSPSRRLHRQGCRQSYPTDPGFKPVVLSDLYVPAVTPSAEKRLDIAYVEERIFLQCGDVYGCCPGLRDPCSHYNRVREVSLESTTGHLEMHVLPGAEDDVYERLQSLCGKLGEPIAVERRVQSQPTAAAAAAAPGARTED